MRQLDRQFSQRELERVLVGYLVSKNGKERAAKGSVKEAVLKYAKRHRQFTVDSLLEAKVLPVSVTRKSLIANLNWLERDKAIKLKKDSQRGRGGKPKIYTRVGR